MQITELEGHKALVTSVLVVPSTARLLNYCWTSSLDGTIRYWDFFTSELIKTIDIRLPIFSMVIPGMLSKQDNGSGKPADLFAYVTVEDISKPGDKPKPLCGQIRKCNLTTSKLAGVILKETSQASFITGSPSGEFFSIQSKRTLYIWKVPADDSERALVKKMKLHHTKNFTTMAFHPSGSIVAAGDVTGRILVWRGFGSRILTGVEQNKAALVKHEDEKPGVRGDDDADSCSTWHWHSSEVKFLSFSPDGAYLYSGGNEGVLVLWQLETGKKKFLPRIGSTLLYFVQCPDPTVSAISCADNQIHLLKMSSLQIFKSIAGIKLPCPFPDMWSGLSSGIFFDRSAGVVALPTENYRIQFYSLLDNREISEVQICERNYQPSHEITVAVSIVALSHDGSTMCTVETRLPEDGIGGLVCLKFWACMARKKDFELSTIVYEPHRDSAISAIAFHPARRMSVSSSYGADFKIWVRNDVPQGKEHGHKYSSWVCHSVGSYKKKPMTAAAFSADGSVLAVAAETSITLWDPDRNYLVAVIGETYTPIVSLSFVGKSEYIVSTSHGSRPQLSLWCISKLCNTWSYNLFIEAVACADDASSFAVLACFPAPPDSVESQKTSHFLSHGIILLFDVNSPVPAATWLVKKAKGGGLSFLAANQLSSLKERNSAAGLPSTLLVYVNGDHEYVLFDPYSKEQQEFTVSHKRDEAQLEETGRLGYTSIYGELPEFNPQKTSRAAIVPAQRPWETIFNGPSHALPPLTKLCSAFLESLLEKRTTASG